MVAPRTQVVDWAALPPAARPGQPLRELATPALLLDLDAFERNLDALQSAADGAGVAVRAHAKAHKCPPVALAQLARGAAGVCCQKASEALPFLQAGVRDILVCNQLAGTQPAAWLAAWAAQDPGLRLATCVDDAAQVAVLGAATAAAGSMLDVLVEIDIGQGRCGVADADAVRRLVDAIARHPGLRWRGLQAYHGSVQHVRARAERRDAALRAAERAGVIVQALQADGLRVATVSGGGTGSAEWDLQSGVYTEIQAGSYAFMDRDYADNEPGAGLRFEHALFVATRVMSTARPGQVVVDAGLKSLTLECGLPAVWPAARGLRYTQANDEHGLVHAEPGQALPALGEVLALVPGHCDPTFNLHDELVGYRGDTVEAVWPIAARGLSR